MSQIGNPASSGGPLSPTNFATSPNPGVSLLPVAGTAITAKRSDEVLALDVTAAYAFSGLGLTHINDATQSSAPSNGSLTTAGGLGVAKNIQSGGTVTGVNVSAGASGSIFWSGKTSLQSPVDGTLQFSNFGVSALVNLTVPITATLQLGAANAASPVAQTLQSQGSRSGTDTNVAGANLTIASGQGTGNATGSSLIFQTPTAVASGTGAQTMTTRLTLAPTLATFSGALTVSGQLNTQDIAVASNKQIGWGAGFARLSSSADGQLDFNKFSGGAAVPISAVGAATLQLGAVNAASPVDQTLQAQGSRAGSDVSTSGAGFSISAGIGTGNAGTATLTLNGIIGTTVSTTTAQTKAAGISIPGVAAGQLPGAVIGSAAIATNATDGFIYIPSCAGPPTGTPTAFTGRVPLVYDSINDQLYVYSTAWKQPKTPAGAAIVNWQ